MLALVRGGIPYDEAMEMSPLECDRTLALLAAWAIPPDDRIGGTVDAGPSIVDQRYGK